MTINQITKNFTTTKLLREMSFGNWENKKFQVLKKQFPKLTKMFVQGSEKFKAPKGESFQDMVDRSMRFISKLNDELSGLVKDGSIDSIKEKIRDIAKDEVERTKNLFQKHKDFFNDKKPSINSTPETTAIDFYEKP